MALISDKVAYVHGLISVWAFESFMARYFNGKE
jgi:hypothetical protein